VMAARFQRDVCRRAARALASLPQRNNLRVVQLLVEMRSLASDLSIADYDSTHLRIGRSQTQRRARKLQRSPNESHVDLELSVR
jgi:hypothetical protein